MSDPEAYQLACLPSLSTATRPTRFSGRGVGLDVVRENVERLGGRISIASSPGRGSRVELALPLTLALIQALLVRSAGQLFALPVTRVRTSLDWTDADEGGGVAKPGGADPVRLDEWLGLNRAGSAGLARTALLLEAGGGSIGVVVDEVLGRREVVVRPLGPPLNSLVAYSGAAMLEDGSIVLVLDPESIVASRASNEPPRSSQVLLD
jgi:two-component system chemotaxis sensor kinase CheA